jgi:ABC-type branched-subunit amino acid transport system ATPase component/ABC-type branched-subunit amino acid transport system permease subunit
MRLRELPRSYQVSAVAAGAVLVGTQVFQHRMPLGTVLYGVLYGGVNGLLAVGLVLTYRVTRSINFALGAMGGLPAGIGVSLYVAHGWPWAAVVALSLTLGGLVGLGVGALIDWRFSKAPDLILTVATIGLAQLLGGLAFEVPKYLHAPSLITSFKTGLSSIHAQINPVLFDGNDLVVLVAVPLAVAGVAWFLLRTDAGRAVRAIADNPDRARLLGIPARRLLYVVWALAGLVAALAVIIQAPTAGVPLDAAAGPTILLAPLAAAVVARMESLPVAFLTAIGLGVVEAVVGLDVSKQSVETPLFLAVILVALLLRRRSESRADASSATLSVAELKPMPAVVRALPEVRAMKIGGFGILAVFALTLPTYLSASRLDEVNIGIVFGLAALSLVVLSGWAGTISLGQMSIVAVGGVVSGDLMMHFNLDLFQSMVGGAAAGAIAAVILGFPALRVPGLYLTATTLAFAVAMNDFFLNPTNFGSVLPSSVLRPNLWKRFALSNEGDLYFLCLGILVLAAVLVTGIRSTRPGRALLATRDNARAAEAAAVPTTRTRLTAFVIAGVIAGVAGALYAVILGSIGYQTAPPTDSITVFCMVVVGGITSVGGALAGVGLLQWIGIERPEYQVLVSGIGVLLILMVFPAGLAGLFERARDAVVTRLARRRDIDTGAWGDETDGSRDGVVVVPDDDTPPAASVGLDHEHGGGEPDDADVLLRCEGVNASYGQLQVLFGIDMTIREGEMVALLGTNGAGKSSLLKSVTGLLPASRGRIMFAGRDVTAARTEDIAALGLTMMPGGRGIFPSLSVAENLRVASWPLRRDRVGAGAARDRVVAMFPILDERHNQLAGNLSGGEQQMLSLAMAFLLRPKLLCIDELSLGLAPAIVADLVEAVRDIHRQGTTVVIVEQSVNVALLLAKRATFLEKGTVRFTGRAADLLDRPDLLRAVFIGGQHETHTEKAATRKVTTKPRRPAPEDPTVELEVPIGTNGLVPALECDQVVKRFGGVTAVNHLDLSVKPHEIVGLIGHNGAGKTTLFDVISGFLTPDSGRIHIDGFDMTDLPPFERSVSGLGRSFQEARLFPGLTVTECIEVALERHLYSREPFAAAFRMPASADSEGAALEKAMELIEQFGLRAFRNRLTGDLSTGTRRIVELACIKAHRPTLLLLDEPTGGVAQSETEALTPVLKQVAADTGCAMVVIEHDMALMSSLCDRLVALELGAVIAEGTPSEVLSHPEVIASYLGTDEVTVNRSGKSRQTGRRPRKRSASTTASAE